MYDIFVIDPPWPQKKGGKRSVRPNQHRELDYRTMSLEDIFLLLDDEIFIHGKKEHIVFLWCIDKFLHEVEEEMQKRGYKLHARMIWDKGNGVAPAFSVRYSHEYVLWYYKGKFQKVDEKARGRFMTVFQEASREHSRKPDKLYNMIEQWYPESVKIDVFSREKRLGWAQFGDECDKF